MLKPETLFKKYLFITVTCCLCWLDAARALGQQTIFNVPSADITEEKGYFYQHQSNFLPWHRHPYWNGTNSFGYGVGQNTELDLTVLNVGIPYQDDLTLGVGAKTAIPLFQDRWKERELKVTVGDLIPIPLQNGQVGNWAYGHLSGRLPVLNTRLTMGLYEGTKQLFGRNAFGVLAGYEHPVGKHFMLQGDWFSGNNDLSYFIPGAVIILKNGTMLSFGYQLHNSRAHRVGNGYVVELTTYIK